ALFPECSGGIAHKISQEFQSILIDVFLERIFPYVNAMELSKRFNLDALGLFTYYGDYKSSHTI
ncbi:hypothetical protein ACJX0J_032643, partial [Zea mays]